MFWHHGVLHGFVDFFVELFNPRTRVMLPAKLPCWILSLPFDLRLSSSDESFQVGSNVAARDNCISACCCFTKCLEQSDECRERSTRCCSRLHSSPCGNPTERCLLARSHVEPCALLSAVLFRPATIQLPAAGCPSLSLSPPLLLLLAPCRRCTRLPPHLPRPLPCRLLLLAPPPKGVPHRHSSSSLPRTAPPATPPNSSPSRATFGPTRSPSRQRNSVKPSRSLRWGTASTARTKTRARSRNGLQS